MKREVHIVADFSNPIDLAQQLGRWSEFHSGAGCEVDLYNAYTHEHVRVRHRSREDELSFVSVVSEQPGKLFEAVLGEVIYSLSQHSDDLTVRRCD